MPEAMDLRHAVPFSSAAELAFLIGGLGPSLDVIQLEVGKLTGTFLSQQVGGALLISIKTSRRLLIFGARQTGVISVSFETQGLLTDHAAHGQAMDDPFTIAGIKPDLRDIYCQLTAGSANLFALFSHADFDRFLRGCGQHRVADCLYLSNQKRLTASAFAALREALVARLERPGLFTAPDADQNFFAVVLEALLCGQEHDFIPFKLTSRGEVVKNLLRWSFSDEFAPVGLDKVSQCVFTSRRTLIQACQDSFGLGPMELLRYIRLHRVHSALADPRIRMRLGLEKVNEIARHYGFLSRGHFARAYQEIYGCSPAATLVGSR